MSKKMSVKAKAPLAVRIALIALAMVLLAVGLLAVVNLTAMGNYNQATQRLNENIKLVQQEDADLDKQYASQQQTDAQFEDAGAFSVLLLPSLRENIDYNSDISSQLTKLMEQQLNADDQSSSDTTEDSAGGTVESGTAGGNLTDEQLRKVEELLKQNTSSTQSDGNDDSSGSGTAGNESDSSQAKPW